MMLDPGSHEKHIACRKSLSLAFDHDLARPANDEIEFIVVMRCLIVSPARRKKDE